MKEKITQRTLGKLDATGVRFFIWDTGLTGFGIEVSAKGKATYVCEARIKGTTKKVRTKIGLVDLLPLEEARQSARAMLLQASQGVDPRFEAGVVQDGPASVGQAVNDYIEVTCRVLVERAVQEERTTVQLCHPP